MVPSYCFVVQNVNGAVISGHNRIEPAVVVEVANCQATRNPGLTEDVPRSLETSTNP